ncbi:MAG: LysM peptidoglycan-binding domain-containing M23 family metallopeptidase [Spirochaetales bacterium]|nr:LysM peptidoglycan-binding domain-containing M23 family metallopeptidase [Spirochaetales bacterium]
MVVTRERQDVGKRGTSLSFKLNRCPSASFLGAILFFILLGMGFPGEAFMNSQVSPVRGEVRKAAAPSPFSSREVLSEEDRAPILPFIQYEVEKGETISLIASRYSLKTDTLISLNQLVDPKEIRGGRILYIPPEDGARRRLGDDMTVEDLADYYSLPSDYLVPLGDEEYFLPGVEANEAMVNRFWGENFSYPVNGTLNGEYGTRKDVLTGLDVTKQGWDFRTYPGQEIFSIGKGIVSKRGFHGTYGWYMIVNYREGYQALYAHLDSFEAEEGATVKRGETIARAGNSGHTPGNILFFSLFDGGDAIDPTGYLY